METVILTPAIVVTDSIKRGKEVAVAIRSHVAECDRMGMASCDAIVEEHGEYTPCPKEAVSCISLGPDQVLHVCVEHQKEAEDLQTGFLTPDFSRSSSYDEIERG